MQGTLSVPCTYVRDHIPLEQGLRRAKVTADPIAESVRDHIPLEQGLRRFAIGTVY